MKYPPTREEYYDLINKLKLLEQQIKQNNDDDDNDTTQEMTKEEKKASKFTKVDVELESIPKDDRKNTHRRNYLTEMYHNNTVRRKSMKLLGEDVVMDDWLDWRVKWGQRGIGIFGLLGLVCFILGYAANGNVGYAEITISTGTPDSSCGQNEILECTCKTAAPSKFPTSSPSIGPSKSPSKAPLNPTVSSLLCCCHNLI